jgi:endoglucanase
MARTRLAVHLFGAALLVAVSSSAWADRKLPVPNPLQDSANSNEVSLHWSNVGGETGFLVERRLAGGSFAEIGKTTADATSYKDTLTVDGEYEYRVRAYRSTGANLSYSDYTNVVDVVASTSTTSTSTGGTTTSSSGGTTTTSSPATPPLPVPAALRPPLPAEPRPIRRASDMDLAFRLS